MYHRLLICKTLNGEVHKSLVALLGVIFRTNAFIFGTNPVIFKTNPVIIRTNQAMFYQVEKI